VNAGLGRGGMGGMGQGAGFGGMQSDLIRKLLAARSMEGGF